MAATTTNLTHEFTVGSGRDGARYPVAASATAIPKGVLVNVVKGVGNAQNGTDVSNGSFIGVSIEAVDNSGGSAGDKYIRVAKSGLFDFAPGTTAATRANFVGYDVYVYDNAHVDLVGVCSTGTVKVGRCVDVLASGLLLIDILTQ